MKNRHDVAFRRSLNIAVAPLATRSPDRRQQPADRAACGDSRYIAASASTVSSGQPPAGDHARPKCHSPGPGHSYRPPIAAIRSRSAAHR